MYNQQMLLGAEFFFYYVSEVVSGNCIEHVLDVQRYQCSCGCDADCVMIGDVFFECKANGGGYKINPSMYSYGVVMG